MYMFGGCTWLYAPPSFLWAFSSPSPCRLSRCGFPMATPLRIAIVGDVSRRRYKGTGIFEVGPGTLHRQVFCSVICRASTYGSASGATLSRTLSLAPRACRIMSKVSAGDFGNENVDLVESISNLNLPKAIILGNHDAWSTQKFSSIGKDPVQMQLKFLGEEHVGYRRMDFPIFNLSIVGGRPFSCGGDRMFRKKLLVARYGVNNMDGSAKRIYKAALGTPAGHSVIFLAHNGPTGLGSSVDDICGRDWFSDGGDHGDPDLAKAISQLKEATELPIKLVVFGHMHKGLAYGKGLRKMLVVGDDKVIYLNGAIVPRVKPVVNEQINDESRSGCGNTSTLTSDSLGTIRAFTIVDILDGHVEKIAETWVSVSVNDVKSEDEIVLFSRASRLI